MPRLETRLSILNGVGPVTETALLALGLNNVKDLLLYYPRRYDDFTQLRPIAELRPGLVSVRARLDQVTSRRSFKRKGMSLTEAIISDDTGSLKLTWFNNKWVTQQLTEGKEYFWLGELKFAGNTFGITQPTFESVEGSQLAGKILPVYPESAAIDSKLLRKLIAHCASAIDELPDYLPEKLREQHGLMSQAEACRELHFPTSAKELERARQSQAFTELFLLFAAGLVIRSELATEPGIPIPFDEKLAKEFAEKLPYTLTDGQRASAWQIVGDLQKDKPMNRLLEGDVGSGKTVVAAFAALQAIRAGHQVALMVPTDILARQHYNSLTMLLAPWDVRVTVLTSRLPAAEKKQAREAVESGESELIIGTQALLAQGTQFTSLGLIIVDEQHRFGVRQRIALKDKAGRLPHVLTMTATPIPRTLALVLYGDLELSIIKELPPGRQPTRTQVAFEADRVHIYNQMSLLLDQGQQAYIVCPAIDETDSGGMKAASAEYKALQKGVFKHRRIGLVHGKLKTDEKNAVMADFVAGKLDILVATTVIEVGIHVPNATMMIVEQAERFGLATLHQLRGRVGRGDAASVCFLFTDSTKPLSVNRLRALERTSDGFRLAEIDLESRGAGERFGHRQSGEEELRFAALTDRDLVERVSQAAQAFLKEENIVEYPQTLERINRLKSVTSLD